MAAKASSTSGSIQAQVYFALLALVLWVQSAETEINDLQPADLIDAHTVLLEYQIDQATGAAIVSSRREVLRVPMNTRGHIGGGMVFSADGNTLFVSTATGSVTSATFRVAASVAGRAIAHSAFRYSL